MLKTLLHAVRIVGEAAHELAVCMSIKELQRQGLELGEQIAAQACRTALGQLHHDSELRIGACRPQKVYTEHGEKCFGKFYDLFRGREIADKLVEHRTEEIGSGNA